jgi:DNA processing protein
MEEIVALIALSRLPGVKNIVKKGVAEGHEKIGPLFEGKVKTDDEALNIAIRAFKGWKEIERDLGFLKRMGATPISIKEKDYPEMLREIPDAPVILYKIGERQITRDAIAIVGSRRATWEGRNLAERIANTLSSMGVTVVSGLARGIDAAAHAGSLEEKGGTIAVMGSGIDICYPSENRWLYEDKEMVYPYE